MLLEGRDGPRGDKRGFGLRVWGPGDWPRFLALLLALLLLVVLLLVAGVLLLLLPLMVLLVVVVQVLLLTLVVLLLPLLLLLLPLVVLLVVAVLLLLLLPLRPWLWGVRGGYGVVSAGVGCLCCALMGEARGRCGASCAAPPELGDGLAGPELPRDGVGDEVGGPVVALPELLAKAVPHARVLVVPRDAPNLPDPPGAAVAVGAAAAAIAAAAVLGAMDAPRDLGAPGLARLPAYGAHGGQGAAPPGPCAGLEALMGPAGRHRGGGHAPSVL